jgi:GDPmannose 4,6-dehydratase
MKSALIFGVTGQDGSYLTELLLSKGYVVYGGVRRTSTRNHVNINHIKDDNFKLVHVDVTDAHSVQQAVAEALRDSPSRLEVYNLAAQSHVHTSFKEAKHTTEVVLGGTLNILEALRETDKKIVRYYQASSSEMFGASKGTKYSVDSKVNRDDFNLVDGKYYQNEETPFHPRSPYGVAKVAAHHATHVYKDAYKLFACCGILFNHESERRGHTFVSKKITEYVGEACAKAHKNSDRKVWDAAAYKEVFEEIGHPTLKLGNTESYRDWGYAPEFVEAMWLMLQQDIPDDYVIATGEAHSVKEFLVEALQVGLGYYSDRFVETDSSLYRQAEVNYLCGDYSKAKSKLGWQPKTKFYDLVEKMVHADVKKAYKEAGVYLCR